MFLTLDGVRSDVVNELMDAVYNEESVMLNKDKMVEVKNILIMLGVDQKLFTVDKVGDNKEVNKAVSKPVDKIDVTYDVKSPKLVTLEEDSWDTPSTETNEENQSKRKCDEIEETTKKIKFDEGRDEEVAQELPAISEISVSTVEKVQAFTNVKITSSNTESSKEPQDKDLENEIIVEESKMEITESVEENVEPINDVTVGENKNNKTTKVESKKEEGANNTPLVKSKDESTGTVKLTMMKPSIKKE